RRHTHSKRDWISDVCSSDLHQFLAGLVAGNYVKLDVVARNQPGQELVLGGELVSEIDGGFGAGGNEAVDLPAEPENGYWHLRLKIGRASRREEGGSERGEGQ